MARGTADTSLVKQGYSRIAYTPETLEDFKKCADLESGPLHFMTNHVKIQHPKFLYNIIGTHLQDIDSDVKNTRRAQIKQLKEFISTLPFKKNEPFFLIGDFNICPFKEDELYNYFKRKLKAESIRAKKQTHIDNYLLDYILKLYPKHKSYDYNVRVFNLMDDKGYPVSDHSIVYTSVNVT